jgi:hypothetical protein
MFLSLPNEEPYWGPVTSWLHKCGEPWDGKPFDVLLEPKKTVLQPKKNKEEEDEEDEEENEEEENEPET